MSKTHVVMVVDESGSMMNLQKSVIDGFNEYINQLKVDTEDAELTTVTLVKANGKAIVEYVAKPLLKVKTLNTKSYQPYGSTPLFDSIGRGVTELAKLVDDEDTAIVIVQTDGYENSSKEFTRQQILDLIASKEATKKWTFVYLGADQDAFAAGTSMGFQGTNSYAYAATAGSTHDTYSSLAASTVSLRSAKAQGVTASTDFLEDAGLSEDDLDKSSKKGSTKGTAS